MVLKKVAPNVTPYMTPDLLVLLYYLFDFEDLFHQVVDDKEEEDNLEAQHQVVRPIDIAKQLHRVKAEVFCYSTNIAQRRACSHRRG